MGRITVVGTAHRGSGLCNADELLRILEAIRPDVIFEEIRPADFELAYRDPSKHTLEMRAVGNYLKVRPARQVPVDDYVIPDTFRRDMASLEQYVVSNNAEYGDLMDEISEKQHLFGFRFLNSPEFQSLNKRADAAFERTIAKSGSEDLTRKLSLWNDQIKRRNVAMVENVHDFCRTNAFTEGVLLVGAGHVPPILEGIESHGKPAANPVVWQKLKA